MKQFQNALHLGIKELRGLRHDIVMLLLIVDSFSFGEYGPTKVPVRITHCEVTISTSRLTR